MAGTTVNLYGPPGCGKTTACMKAVMEWLAEGAHPRDIGYFAFTKVAAQEALSRIVEETGESADSFSGFRTLHSEAYRLIRCSTDRVVQKWTLAKWSKARGVFYAASGQDLEDLEDEGIGEGNRMIGLWDRGRNTGATGPDDAWDRAPVFLKEPLSRVKTVAYLNAYEAWKTENGWVDFADMLRQAVESDVPPSYGYTVVDEAQDLTPLMWDMARLCERNAVHALRAGDDDQAAYAFTGADARQYVEIEGERRILEQSYRVPRVVHERAVALIERNKVRVPKAYHPRLNAEGAIERRQRRWTDLPETGTVAGLFRNRRHVRAAAESLIESSIPFTSNRVAAPLDHAALPAGLHAALVYRERGKLGANGVLALVSMIASTPLASHYLERGAKPRMEREATSRPFGFYDRLPLSDEGERVLRDDPFLLADGAKGARSGYIDYLRRVVDAHGADALKDPPRLTLTTVHGAKGREFDHVRISSDAVRRCQDGIADDPETERRLKYIALTRARETVTLLPPAEEGGWEIQ